MQRTYKCNTETRSRNHRHRGKAICITYSQCVALLLDIQYTKRMSHIIFSSVVCPDLPYFSTLFDKRYDFLKKIVEPKTCVLISTANLSETSLILRRSERDMTKQKSRSSCKVPVRLG